MFKFLKEKLKSFFKKSERVIEEAEKEEAIEPIKDKKEKLEEKDIELRKEPEKEKKKGVKESKEAEFAKEVKAEEKHIEEIESKDEAKDAKNAGFFSKLIKRFDAIRLSEESFDRIWQDLEAIMLENNVAFDVIDAIKEKLKPQLIEKEMNKKEIELSIKSSLRQAISELLIEPFDFLERIKESINEKGKPFIIVFFGINGTGKTTTIAKIANLLSKNGLKSVIAASDTFRAASIEQLQKHASKLNVKLLKHDYGSDAAAVAYDAIQYAKANNLDVVLIDTAGRMHTEVNLMKEMEKICRVNKPHLKVFVGESIVGNDMLEQAKSFLENIGLDCIILTKADVDEKGGTSLSASYVTKKPILFLGTGQDYEDLEKFDKEKILSRIGL